MFNGARSEVFRPPSTGFYHFGVQPWGTPALAPAAYSITATLVGDDHPDTAAEAVILPGWMDDVTISGRTQPGDVDHFRVYVPRGDPVNVWARCGDGIRVIGAGDHLSVRDSAGVEVSSCDFCSRSTSACFVAINGPGIFDVSIAPNLRTSGGAYLLNTAPRIVGGHPGLRCSSASLAGGTWLLDPQCDLGRNPHVSGVIYAESETEHLWFEAHEGKVYSIRFLSSMAEATLHYPTAANFTSPDTVPLFRLPALNDATERAEGRQSVTFVAPVTGWYRLRVVGKVPSAEGLEGTYPSIFTVEFAEASALLSDYPELEEWSHVPSTASCP
jgi:hypothetical protein